MANRLASILQQEYKTKGLVGGTASAVGKAAKEKLDIRNALFSGEGIGSVIGTKIFGKGYSATKREKTGTQKSTSPESLSSALSSGESPVLQEMNANMKLTAKNSMSLPMMARDMNLMKLNIFKLVKSFGDKPNTNKTDMFWEKSKIRDAAYNNTIGKMMGKGKLGTLAKGVFVGKKERDGQTPETALYINSVAGGANGEDESSIVGDVLSFVVLKRILAATLGFLTGPVGLTILGGFGLFKVMENLMDKNADKEGVDLTTKALGGSLDESQIGSEIMKAAEEGQAQREAEDLKRRTVSGPLQRQMPAFDSNGSGTYDSPLTTEGYGVDEKGKTPTPTNAVTSSSGSPIGTGTPGVYVTSGSTPSPSVSPSAIASSQSNEPSEELINNIKRLEGFTAKATWDYKQYSNGYGTKALSEKEVIDEKEADRRLRDKVKETRDIVVGYGKKHNYGFNPSQIDSLTSFAYNLGPGILNQVTGGGKRSIQEIAEAMPKYNKVTKNGQLVVETGLEKRRNIELAMFTGGSKVVTPSAPSVTSAPKSTGSAIASASTSVSDQKMAAMIPTGGQTTVVNGAPITVGSSKSSSRVSPFQKEFHDKIISAIALT